MQFPNSTPSGKLERPEVPPPEEPSTLPPAPPVTPEIPAIPPERPAIPNPSEIPLPELFDCK
jgi:hypothetical protein